MKKFPGGASPYMLYNMKSFLMGMCTFQTLRQCDILRRYLLFGLVPEEMGVGVKFFEVCRPNSSLHLRGATRGTV